MSIFHKKLAFVFCQRLKTTQTCFLKSFYSTVSTLETQSQPIQQDEQLEKEARLESLRKAAKKIRTAYGIRSRCIWTAEEDRKLKALYEEYGPKWKSISKKFADRMPLICQKRYELLGNGATGGPWKPEEIEALMKAGEGKGFEQIHDWEKMQKALPAYRPLFLVKQKYAQKDPTKKKGRWELEEIRALDQAIVLLGQDWDKVSTMVKSRSAVQCQERWRWQQKPMHKGFFTEEEDRAILKAVQKYGTNFGVIRKVISSQRSSRHISQHYQSVLNPDVDRSPWTLQESMLFYQAYKKHGSAKKAKDALGSKRSIRNIWNRIQFLRKSEAERNRKE